jgi:hypothetical protein
MLTLLVGVCLECGEALLLQVASMPSDFLLPWRQESGAQTLEEGLLPLPTSAHPTYVLPQGPGSGQFTNSWSHTITVLIF